MKRRVALVVGDTAGHVNPALAVADAFAAAFAGVEIFVLAAEDGPASRLVPAAGYDLVTVPALPLARVGLPGKLRATARVFPTMTRARQILRERGSKLVIGSGGYASGAVLLAARWLGLRTAIIEPNAELGLANRLLKRVTHRAYVTVPAAARSFSAGQVLVTGTPVRRATVEALRSRAGDRGPTPMRILVTSGSRGDEFFAGQVPGLVLRLEKLGIDVEVLHQTSEFERGRVEADYVRMGLRARVESHLDSLADAYSWATFAIARAGAGTLAELSLAGLPALLVPLADAAHDHQVANARWHTENGAAMWVREPEWETGQVAQQLSELLRDASRWTSMQHSARQLANPAAAERIVRDCEEVMTGRW